MDKKDQKSKKAKFALDGVNTETLMSCWFRDAGYMHRDIKGDNVLVADDGQLKVADLGLCGPIENRRTGIGTPQYLAPEAVQNRLEEQEQLLTTAVDIYSFGMLMYKLLMKRYPHRLADKTPKVCTFA